LLGCRQDTAVFVLRSQNGFANRPCDLLQALALIGQPAVERRIQALQILQQRHVEQTKRFGTRWCSLHKRQCVHPNVRIIQRQVVAIRTQEARPRRGKGPPQLVH
jgi:hypothetical protein